MPPVGGPDLVDTRRVAGSSSVATPVPHPRSSAIILVVGFVALFLCLVVIGVIAEDIHGQEAFALDTLMTPLLHSVASPTLDTIMWSMTTLASTMVVAPIFIVAEALLIRGRRRREAIFLGVATLGSVLLSGAMKLIFQRPRPQLPWAQTPLDFSFPSGHTMNGLVFYLALAIVAWAVYGPRVGAVSVVVAATFGVLVGISRIYLGAHYFTDVVGGYLAGIAWLLIVAGAFHIGDRLATWRLGHPESQPPGAPAPRG